MCQGCVLILLYVSARYHTCCNGRGCTKCYFSLDSMLPNKVLIDHAHRVSGRAPEREEDDMRYAEEDDGNHTRFILHYDELKDEVVDSLSAYLYVSSCLYACVRIPLCLSPHVSVYLG